MPGAFDNPIRFDTASRLGNHILMNAIAPLGQPSSAAALPDLNPALGDTADFTSLAPGHWPEVPPGQWNDWKWQLKNRVTTLAQLERYLVLTPDERAGVTVAGSKLSMAITPHFFNLIERDNPDCPIRRQVIPRLAESLTTPFEMADPCGEDSHMPVPGLVHRYPDRVLFLVTDRCASYCRYCTRSRVVSGAGDQELHTNFEEALRYIETTRKSATCCFRVATRFFSPTTSWKVCSNGCAPSRTSSSCGSARGCRSSCRSALRPNSARCSPSTTRSG